MGRPCVRKDCKCADGRLGEVGAMERGGFRYVQADLGDARQDTRALSGTQLEGSGLMMLGLRRNLVSRMLYRRPL